MREPHGGPAANPNNVQVRAQPRTRRFRPMPHVELLGGIRASAVHESFQPATVRVGGSVFKTRACYLRSDGREALVEVLVVEGYLKQSFLAQIRDREDGVIIRLYPHTPVQRSDGVKLFVAWLGAGLRRRSPDIAVGATNLQGLLEELEQSAGEAEGGEPT
jgi:hypothetical protein